jgi:hypothetical protein
MELKAVPKPESHDLNAARADKFDDAASWLPEDALYSAWKDLEAARARGAPVKALIIAWYEPTDSRQGSCQVNRRMFCETTNDGTALLTDLFFVANGR